MPSHNNISILEHQLEPTAIFDERSGDFLRAQQNKILHCFQKLIVKGGPDPAEYTSTLALFNQAAQCRMPAESITEVFRPTLVNDCLHGFGHNKPHGYAGDYEMIDRIYTKWESSNRQLVNWDRFFHSQAAPQAVRNRKEIFKLELQKLPDGARVLNLGSGPCRDLKEFLEENPAKKLSIVNVDICERALNYAKHLCQDILCNSHLDFAKCNILRFQSECEFDLIWSSGLFDYFSDRLLIRVLRRLTRFQSASGQIVIGNFGVDNPSRNYMELLGQWKLIHRSVKDLVRITLNSGIEPNSVSTFAEQTGVNLFLRISNSPSDTL